MTCRPLLSSLIGLLLFLLPLPADASQGRNVLVNNIDAVADDGRTYSVKFCFWTTDVGGFPTCAGPNQRATSDYDHGPKNFHLGYVPGNSEKLPFINFDESCREYFGDTSRCLFQEARHESRFCTSKRLRDADGGGTHTITLTGKVLNGVNGLLLSCRFERIHVN